MHMAGSNQFVKSYFNNVCVPLTNFFTMFCRPFFWIIYNKDGYNTEILRMVNLKKQFQISKVINIPIHWRDGFFYDLITNVYTFFCFHCKKAINYTPYTRIHVYIFFKYWGVIMSVCLQSLKISHLHILTSKTGKHLVENMQIMRCLSSLWHDTL